VPASAGPRPRGRGSAVYGSVAQLQRRLDVVENLVCRPDAVLVDPDLLLPRPISASATVQAWSSSAWAMSSKLVLARWSEIKIQERR
jgi:hypothetical protein